MTGGDLHLAFPQWQGAGTGSGLAEGGARLCRLFGPSHKFVAVDVRPDAGIKLPIENGIRGRAAILGQLQAAQRIIKAAAPARVLTVGGDCGVELAPISYLNHRYGSRMAVLWLDAHADLHTTDSSCSHNFHGMPLRMLLGEGDAEFAALVAPPLNPAQVILAGARALDVAEADYLDRHPSLCRIDVDQLRQDPSGLAAAVRDGGFDHAYVHIDLDVLDPMAFPWVPCPTPNGISIDHLQRAVASVARVCEIVGVSLLEHSGCTDGADARADGESRRIVRMVAAAFAGSECRAR